MLTHKQYLIMVRLSIIRAIAQKPQKWTTVAALYGTPTTRMLPLHRRWNQLDVGIVILSVVGIVLEEMENDLIPINPTIIRVMRVMRIARGEWCCQ